MSLFSPLSVLLPLPLAPCCLQAVDILHPWTLDPSTGAELAPFTTFSIAMIHRQSRGQLPLFVAGLERFKALKVGGWVGGQEVEVEGGGRERAC